MKIYIKTSAMLEKLRKNEICQIIREYKQSTLMSIERVEDLEKERKKNVKQERESLSSLSQNEKGRP